MKATCYHFRNMKGVKVVGGSLGMSRPMTLEEGAAQVAAMLDVRVSASGCVTFLHKGADVYAYLSLDPAGTEKGRAALKDWRAQRAAAEVAEREARGCTCGGGYNCCSCGGNGCGCSGCFDCNACEACRGVA